MYELLVLDHWLNKSLFSRIARISIILSLQRLLWCFAACVEDNAAHGCCIVCVGPQVCTTLANIGDTRFDCSCGSSHGHGTSNSTLLHLTQLLLCIEVIFHSGLVCWRIVTPGQCAFCAISVFRWGA